MTHLLLLILVMIPRLFSRRMALEADFFALRHQLLVLRRTSRRSQIPAGDRIFWSWLSE